MTLTERYNSALADGDIDRCIGIEQGLELYGYPPEIVSVGIAAFDAGEDHHQAVQNYVNNPPVSTGEKQ